MGRLKRLQPTLAGMPPRVAYLERQPDAMRDTVQAWRGWYKTARWQRLRWRVLVDALFTCARCRVIEGKTALLVADHKRAHRGDPDLFWDRSNLQCLCKQCHDRDKQREEAAERRWR